MGIDLTKERIVYYSLDENGVPVPETDVVSWGRKFEGSHRYRVVARTTVTEGVDVSTVFLGIDHNWGDGPPLLWETLVFGGDLDGEMQRTSTRHEAIDAHWAIIGRVKATLPASVTVQTPEDTVRMFNLKLLKGQSDDEDGTE